MRVHETHEVMYLDLDYPEMLIRWGGPRRKRVKPRAMTVTYRRDSDSDWKLRCAYLGCDRVHKIAKFGLGIFLYDFGEWRHSAPDWVHELIESAKPELRSIHV